MMEENVNDESVSVKSRKKRRKKNNSLFETNTVNENSEGNEVNTEVTSEGRKDKTEPKTKRKRKLKQTLGEQKFKEGVENSIHHHISQLHEDVVNVSEQPLSQSTQHLLTSVWHTNVNNNCSNGKLFIERARGAFKAIKAENIEAKKINKTTKVEKDENLQKSKSVAASLKLYTSLQKLAKFAHGLLAGFAIYHLFLVNCLEFPQFSLLEWLQRFSKLSLPTEAIFYLLSIFCLWMMLARCNVGGDEGMLWENSRRFYGILFIIILYATTTIISLSLAKMNTEISLMKFNQSTTEQVFVNTVSYWKNFNWCRSIAAILAWMALCVSYPYDLNKSFLKKILIESPITEQQIEIN